MHLCFVCGRSVRDGEGHWRKEGGCPRFGVWGSGREIWDEEDLWDDNGEWDEDGGEERARAMQRVGMEEEEEEDFRRAFEVQMRIVGEMRRELEEGERARRGWVRVIEGRVHGGEGGNDDGGDAERRRERRRRRREREADRWQDVIDGPQREWQRRDDLRGGEEHSPRAAHEQGRRGHRGFRAFINDAIDATEHVLFGKEVARRR
jgi:hypothetical protein